MAFRTNKTPVLQEKSASGSVASFNTALAMPLASCTSLITGYQEGSGTPSPDNVRPINGYSAINIANASEDLYHDITMENGYLDIYGNVQASGVSSVTDYIPVVEGLVYYYYDYVTAALGPRNICIYDDSKQFVSYISYETVNKKAYFSIPSNGAYVRITIDRNYTNQHLYNGTTTTIQIGSTVYDGEYDARTGVFTVTQVKEILRGSYFSTYSASIQCAGGGKPAGWLPWLKQTGGSCEMLSHGLPTTRSNIGNISNGCFIGDTTGGNQEIMYIKFAGYSSLEDVQAFIEAQYNSNTPVEVVYELATPMTIQLPPCPIDTLQGENNVWADTGDIDLTYKDLDIAKRGNFREVFKLPS